MGGSSSKTYVNLQVQPLMDDPEKWYKASMNEAFKNIPYGMRSVMNRYVHNMTDARSLFNDTFLSNLGYNPRENIKYRVIDPDLVLNWAKANISNSVTSVSECKFTTPTMEELALEYLQDNYTGMDLDEKSFYIGGVKWYLSGVTVVSTLGSDATCYKNKETTVSNYAISHGTNVISISETIVTIQGVNYWSATLGSGVVNIPVEYTTINCPGINTDIISLIIKEFDGKVYHMSHPTDSEGYQYGFASDVTIAVKLDASGELDITGKVSNIVYNRWSAKEYTMITKNVIETAVGNVKKETTEMLAGLVERLVFKYELNGTTKIMIAEVSEELVSGIANAQAYPIIPLKENFAFVKETNQMKAILNKLGMSGTDFEDSINDSRLKNAAILFVVDIENTSDAATKYLFETLVNMVTTTTIGPKSTVKTAYHLDYGFSDVDMNTKLNFTIEFREGVVAGVGKYNRSTVSEVIEYRDPESNKMIQETTTYKSLRKQVNELYYQELKIISGSTKWRVGGYNLDGITYVPIVDIGLDKLTYEELCYMLSLSVSIMTTSVVTIKSKWYQSGFFKFVMIIIIAILSYFTGGAASLAYGWLAGAVVYAGAVISILGIMGINTGVLGQIIGVAAILVGGYTSIMNATATATTTLQVASTLTQLTSVAVEFNTQGVLKSIEKQRQAKQAELEESNAQMEEMYNSLGSGLWLGVSDREPEMLYALSNTQMMCNYDLLYDYDGLIDGQIKSVGI